MSFFHPDLIVDLHGYLPEMAMQRVRQMCDSKQAKGRTLMIVHGQGKGVLRDQIRRWATSSSKVREVVKGEDYALPGGSGVTLLYLFLFFFCFFLVTSFDFYSTCSAAESATVNKSELFLVEVPVPFNAQTVANIRQALARELKTNEIRHPGTAGMETSVIFRFNCPPHSAEAGKKVLFGDAFEMGQFIHERRFAGESGRQFTTCAIVEQTLSGHVLLPVFACQEIFVRQEATLGPIAPGKEKPTSAIIQAYHDFCNKKSASNLIDGMLSPELKIFSISTEQGELWLTEPELTARKKAGTVFLSDPKEYNCPFGPGKFDAVELRRAGLVDWVLKESTPVNESVFTRLGHSANSLHLVTPLEPVRAGWLSLRGPVTTVLVEATKGRVEEAVKKQEINCLILEIDSEGGSIVDSIDLAQFLVTLANEKSIRLIAYIPRQARSDAALIALSCHDVTIGPDAVLGGLGLGQSSPGQLHAGTISLQKSWAPLARRSWSLPAAMIDPELEVSAYSHSKTGEIAWLTETEFQELGNPSDWQKGTPVSLPGTLFSVTGKDALLYKLADVEVTDLALLRSFYGLDNEPLVMEPPVLDRFFQMLNRHYILTILLCLGFIFFYLELHSPGIGIFALLGFFCFILFFWGAFMGGTLGWPEIILFAVGAVCVFAEIFLIPGFGIVGIFGAGCIIVSIVLATQPFVIPRNMYEWQLFQRSLVILCLACAGVTVVGIIGVKSIARQFIPKDGKEIAEAEKLVDYSNLPGCEGVTTSPLYPAGKAQIGDLYVSVVSNGVPIDAGVPVIVTEVAGNRIVVRKKEEDNRGNC